MWGLHILLPLLPEPVINGSPGLFAGEQAARFYAALLAGRFLDRPALRWLRRAMDLLRTGLILWTLRKPSSPQTCVGRLNHKRGVFS